MSQRGETEHRGPASKPPLRNNPLAHGIVLALLALAAYSNTFHSPFVFDDETSITLNPVIKNLENFFLDSSGYDHNPRRYVGYLTFALNYRFGGLDVTGYHIFNLAVHIVNALLVYFFVLLTFRAPVLRNALPPNHSRAIAWFAAALFAVHPVQTEAVTYIVQRFTSLATMFSLAALVLYAKMRLLQESERPFSAKALSLYLFSLVSIILAMKTKEIAITLPVIVALYEFFFFRGPIRSTWPVLTPILLTLLIVPASLLNVQRPLGEIFSAVSDQTGLQPPTGRWDYLATQFRVVTTYTRLLLLPVNQNLDYDYPVSGAFFSPSVFLSFLFLLGLLLAAIFLYIRSSRGTDRLLRLPSFGILWFFITLSVESSVVPIPDVIFEHRVYLPSVGAFITLAAAGGMAATRRFRRTARLPIILAASLIIALSGATYHRNRVWESDLGLWEDVVAKSPGKSRAHYNLGNILKRDGRIDEAIEHYLTAIHLKPFSAAYNNLGMAYQDKGMPDVAIEQYRQAIHLQQDNATAHNNLASAYWEMGRIDEAIEQFEIAVKIEPDYVNARYNLGMAYEGKGLMDKSIEQFETAMKLDPGDLSIAEALAKARERKRLGPAQQALPPDFRMKH